MITDTTHSVDEIKILFIEILKSKNTKSISKEIKDAINGVLKPFTKRWVNIATDEVKGKIYDVFDILNQKHPNNQFIRNNFFETKYKLSLVYDENNIWLPINKINTNSGDYSILLADILIDSNTYDIEELYKDLKRDYKVRFFEFLHSLPENAEFIYKRYLENGDKYIQNILKNTIDGDRLESLIEHSANKGGWKTFHKGSNGDPIDMLLGIDLILVKDDDYICLQIKGANIVIENINGTVYHVITRNIINSYNLDIIDHIVYGDLSAGKNRIVSVEKDTSYMYYNRNDEFKHGIGYPIPTFETRKKIYIPINK